MTPQTPKAVQAATKRDAPRQTRPVVAWLVALLPRRPQPLNGQRVTLAMLKDLGLSRNDLPAIRTGRFAQDATRRQR